MGRPDGGAHDRPARCHSAAVGSGCALVPGVSDLSKGRASRRLSLLAGAARRPGRSYAGRHRSGRCPPSLRPVNPATRTGGQEPRSAGSGTPVRRSSGPGAGRSPVADHHRCRWATADRGLGAGQPNRPPSSWLRPGSSPGSIGWPGAATASRPAAGPRRGARPGRAIADRAAGGASGAVPGSAGPDRRSHRRRRHDHRLIACLGSQGSSGRRGRSGGRRYRYLGRLTRLPVDDCRRLSW